jgi:hypothetical protein
MSADSSSDAFPSAEELSAVLPQYEITERVSSGGESAIYLARQPALDRSVMIRVMSEPGPGAAVRLMERLRARARLVHSRIIAVYDFGRTTDGWLYLVTEYVDGLLLTDLIAERQLPPKMAYTLALQLCDILTLLHDQGTKHGALNSRTLLVDREGQMKVTGVGMSITPSGDISWLHEGSSSQADDLYALGGVLHEMFGREPLPEDGRVSRNLPPAFGAVIRRCVQVEPQRRFSSAAEIKEALIQALRTQQQSAAAKAGPAASKPPAEEAPAPAAKAATAPASPPPAAAPAPQRYAPGRPPPPVVRAQPSFMKRLDDFLWSCLRAGLHLSVFLITALVLFIFHVMKDKIVLKDPDDPDSKTEEVTMPAEVLGKLPAAPVLPAPPITPTASPITLPMPAPISVPAPPPPDPLAGLNAEYRTAVQAEATAALDQVRLNDLPFIQQELQRLQNGEPVPDTDAADLPATLKRLRDDYRQKRAALTK